MTNEQNRTNYDEKLIERGYHAYPPGPFDDDGIIACFQKRFDDEEGKKYFINVHKWRPLEHPHTHDTIPSGYEYAVQLETKDKRNPINLLFFASWSIEEVEQHVETLFATGMYRHYEYWDIEKENEE